MTQLADKKKWLYLRLYPDIWWKIRRFAIYSMDKCNYLKLVTIRVPKCFLFYWALFMSSKNAAKQIFHFQFYFPFILSLAQFMVIISARWLIALGCCFQTNQSPRLKSTTFSWGNHPRAKAIYLVRWEKHSVSLSSENLSSPAAFYIKFALSFALLRF